MENLNLDQFKKILTDITRNILENLKSIESPKEINGFSLFSDGDGASISASYNTVDYLNQQCEDDSDEDKEYYKWYPAEWKVEGIASNELDALSKTLFEVAQSRNNDQFLAFKNALYNSIVEVLEELKEVGTFTGFSENFILIFYVTDYFDLQQELDWNKRLNNNEQFEEFKIWRSSQE